MTTKTDQFIIQQYSKGTSWFVLDNRILDMNDLRSKFRRLRKVSPTTKFRPVLKQTVILSEEELFKNKQPKGRQ